MTLIPFIVEQEGKIEQAYNIYPRLPKNNDILIRAEIGDDVTKTKLSKP